MCCYDSPGIHMYKRSHTHQHTHTHTLFLWTVWHGTALTEDYPCHITPWLWWLTVSTISKLLSKFYKFWNQKKSGVPQGSIVGPIQLNFDLFHTPENLSLQLPLDCLWAIKWRTFLHLNKVKMEVVIFADPDSTRAAVNKKGPLKMFE